MKRITGRLAEDKGKYYAVINLPNTDGKRKTKWHTLNLEAKKGNKKEAQHRLNQILDKYNAEDLRTMRSKENLLGQNQRQNLLQQGQCDRSLRKRGKNR